MNRTNLNAVVSSYALHTDLTRDALCDADLFMQFLAGDDNAYTTLYNRYSARVLGYIHSIVGTEDSAGDDVFQETFVRLFRERNRYRAAAEPMEPIRNVGGWLFRVARNLALNHIRSQRYLTALPASYDEHLMVTVEEAHAESFGAASNEDQLMAAVHSVVETLPAGLREVFILREVNGMSYQETADIIGCSEEAARMRLSRARTAIRRALQSLFIESQE